MKHHWIVENHREVFLSDFEATELINFGMTKVSLSVDSADWILCDICGTFLGANSINDECAERDGD